MHHSQQHQLNKTRDTEPADGTIVYRAKKGNARIYFKYMLIYFKYMLYLHSILLARLHVDAQVHHAIGTPPKLVFHLVLVDNLFTVAEHTSITDNSAHQNE